MLITYEIKTVQTKYIKIYKTAKLPSPGNPVRPHIENVYNQHFISVCVFRKHNLINVRVLRQTYINGIGVCLCSSM